MKMHTVKKYRFYPSCLFFLQDKWLMKQAKKGLQLIDYGIFTYTFMACLEPFGELGRQALRHTSLKRRKADERCYLSFRYSAIYSTTDMFKY